MTRERATPTQIPAACFWLMFAAAIAIDLVLLGAALWWWLGGGK